LDNLVEKRDAIIGIIRRAKLYARSIKGNATEEVAKTSSRKMAFVRGTPRKSEKSDVPMQRERITMVYSFCLISHVQLMRVLVRH
jgi:hypothetical protein